MCIHTRSIFFILIYHLKSDLRMLRLARENAHSRDLRVTFDEGAHEYSVDGKVID